jgi:hypothetical protein
MASRVDQVFASLKSAKGPGDVFRALSQDPLLLVGLVVVIGILLLILRIYVWPSVNPFNFQWVTDIWNWFKAPEIPGMPKRGVYPYAKVLYPTYR